MKNVYKKKKVWRYLLIEVLVLITFVVGFVVWKETKKDDKAASTPVIEEKNEHKNNTETKSEAQESDYEALGIKAYEYPSEFVMGDNLQAAIVQLALCYEKFDKTVVQSEEWKETFIAKFIQNSRLSFEYLDQVSDRYDGQIGIRELNYIQYSLTNIEVDFSSFVKGSVNRNDASSGITYGSIMGYEYKVTDDRVCIIADFDVGVDGTEAVEKRVITVNLIKNPYSCFDGYSIESISSEKEASQVEQDDEEHVFYGTDMMEKENGEFPFEFLSSEDDLNYSHFVYVDLKESPELADFVRQNAGGNFKVTFVLHGGESDPIERVVPKAITLEEK